MADGASTPLRARLAPVAQSSRLTARIRRGAFAALGEEINPAAVPLQYVYGVDVQPGGAAAASVTGTPDLALGGMAPGDADVDVPLSWGNPYPGSWPVFGFANAVYSIPISVPTDAGPLTLALSTLIINNGTPLDAFRRDGMGPSLSPVRDARVGGQRMLPGASGVGTTPWITWAAPRVGCPTTYGVSIRRIDVAGTRVTSVPVWAGFTPDRSLRVPEGIMIAGGRYLVVVSASVFGDVDLGRTPFQRGFPFARAAAVSGVIIP
jgi:hypothetical protein